MKRLFKWVLRLVLAAAVLVVVGLIFRDSILRVVLEHKIRSETGMDVRIKKFSSGLFSPVLTIENLKIYNTAAFGGTAFLDVPELHLELDPVALRQRTLHVTLMRINLNELDVVRNELGQTNLFSLVGKVQAPDHEGATQLLKKFQFTGIDVLNLTLGRTRYIDLQDSRNNRDTEIRLQNQIFKNVKSEGDVYGILFLIWLRSGGNFSLAPTAVTRDLGPTKSDARP